MRNVSPQIFKRSIGISRKTFRRLHKKIARDIRAIKTSNPLKRHGKKSSLTLKDKILLTFYYLRDYPTFLKLGQDFGISESYAQKIFHSFSSILLKFVKVEGKKVLLKKDIETVVIDVSEQPIERPKKNQKDYYSGKKKRHTIKVQLIACLKTLCILVVYCEKGKVHDFKILKNSKISIHSEIKKLADSGYQGIQEIYDNTEIPFKKPKGGELTPEQKKHNHALAKKRIVIEHVNRRCKIFRIVKETYRGKHKNYGKIWNLVAGIVNLRYAS